MSLWEMSVSGGGLILAILVIRRLFRNKVPSRTFLVLWTAALIRLLVPCSVAAPWSAYTLLENIGAATGMEQLAELMQPAKYKADTLVQGNMGFGYGKAGAEYWRQAYAKDGAGQAGQGYANAKEWMREYARNDEVSGWGWKGVWSRVRLDGSISIWLVIYFGGVLLCAAFYLFTYLKCCREFRTALPAEDPAVREWVASFRTRRQVQVRQSDLVLTPMTYGILHPVILLPKEIKWENPQQMRFVLTHEMVHVQRFDAARKLLFVIAVCMHWCNPLVWVMNVFVNRDMELACDEKVLQYFGQESRAAYAFSLISLAERNGKVVSWGSGFSKDAMEERIVAIMKKKRPTIGAMAGAGILVVFVMVLFAVSAFQKDTGKDYVVTIEDETPAEPEVMEYDKVADLEEISDSSGMILLPVPKKSPSEVSGGMESEQVWEADDQEKEPFILFLKNVAQSEEFPEYEKFGLFYDEENGHLLYHGEIVGYFKDEMGPSLFRKFVDEEGVIGLVVERDDSWKMTGFEEKEMEKGEPGMEKAADSQEVVIEK